MGVLAVSDRGVSGKLLGLLEHAGHASGVTRVGDKAGNKRRECRVMLRVVGSRELGRL